MFSIVGVPEAPSALTVTSAAKEGSTTDTTMGATAVKTVTISGFDAAIPAPFDIVFSIEDDFAFKAACENLKYGVDAEAADVVLAASDYTCAFEDGDDEGMITILVDLPADLTEIKFDLSVANPAFESSAGLDLFFCKDDKFVPFSGSIASFASTSKDTGGITALAMWGEALDSDFPLIGFYPTD